MLDRGKKLFQFYIILIRIVFRFVMCHDCMDVNFELEGLHMCPTDCAECAFFDSCILCRESLSGSTCISHCKLGCFLVPIQNGTWLKGCSEEKVGSKCCINCPHYKICSNCLYFYGPCLKCSNGTYDLRTHCGKECGHCQPDKEGMVQCDLHTGDCNGVCEDGYFGQRCDQTCSKYCIDSATNATKCHQRSGNCVNGCIPGRYDKKCGETCSSTCLGISCNKESGMCTSGCMPGWHGDTCEKSCSNTCVNRSCNQVSAQCTEGCAPGWYGDTCVEVCDVSCINRTCNQISGNCDSGCLPGRFGVTCKELCSNSCKRNTCDQFSGHCDSGCVPGNHGNACGEVCRGSCFNNTCNQLSGHCDKGCVPGWHGVNCEIKCSNFCSNGVCHQLSGYCEHSCTRGWYGDTCEIPCSDTCFNRSCSNRSGICENGCVSGYFGDYCEQNSSDTCESRMCDGHTAQCAVGCRAGFEGSFCNETSAMPWYSATLYTTGILAGAVIAIILSTYTIRFIQKAILGRRRHHVPVLPTRPTAEPIYDEISDFIGSAVEGHAYNELSAHPEQGPITGSYFTIGNAIAITSGQQTDNSSLSEAENSDTHKNPTCVNNDVPETSTTNPHISTELPWSNEERYRKPSTNQYLCMSYIRNKADHENCACCYSENLVESRQSTETEKSRESFLYLHPVI